MPDVPLLALWMSLPSRTRHLVGWGCGGWEPGGSAVRVIEQQTLDATSNANPKRVAKLINIMGQMIIWPIIGVARQGGLAEIASRHLPYALRFSVFPYNLYYMESGGREHRRLTSNETSQKQVFVPLFADLHFGCMLDGGVVDGSALRPLRHCLVAPIWRTRFATARLLRRVLGESLNACLDRLFFPLANLGLKLRLPAVPRTAHSRRKDLNTPANTR
ncbi:hypothetical protein BDK51DRAFT_40539 [Blyttiomyces helicus]|uniref:Uncharacterized protein n=1 Tax=Blyttiomyces helicus TaxID=388810 RepID=A0A4V1IRN8_9FUNG|nr:hypothetical protein BDK51DRAFT_40539 [Blyttiomyces helicus]|eukprot:RKO90707.1 hypothetical protein BDK51DRAFT_40539 [Blyttiomyces helicus]